MLPEAGADGLPRLTAFRLAAWDTPLSVLPNRRAGRYNRAGEESTQYLALHPLTPWAELLRFEERLTEQDGELRPPLWAVRLELHADDVLHLTFDAVESFGLSAEDLVGDDYAPCQAFAARLRDEAGGPRALVVPSAALPGTENVVLLGPKVMIPYDARPIDDSDVAASLAVVEGRSPHGLASLVHHRGANARHAALEAWESGHAYELAAPVRPAAAR